MPAISSTIDFNSITARFHQFSRVEQIGGAIVGVLALYILHALLYAFVLSPIKHIPGPFWAKTTSIPWFWNVIKGRKAEWIRSIQLEYGPVVRVSPDFVVTSDIENVKFIYGQKQIKSHFYKGYGALAGYQFMLGVPDCNTRNPASVARKNLVHIFSQQNLLRMGEMMQDHLANFNRWLESRSDNNEAINAYASFRLLTLDIIANLTFGGNLHLVDQGNPNHEIIRFIDAVVSHNSTAAQVPYMDTVIDILPIQSLKKWKEDSQGLANYGRRALEDWYARGGLEGTKGARDICAKLKEHGQAHPEEAISEGHLITILSEVLLAGSDTTSTTASYIAFELAMMPEVQHKLREELIKAFPDPNERFSIPTLLKLPYLDGLCKEVLRRYPIVPGPLERHNPDPCTLDGYYIPPMTKVGIQAWTQHHDPKVFPDPYKVVPERWYNETPEMKANFLPFSVGPRNCAGMNLANLELRLHIGTILRKYEVIAPPQTTRESLKMEEYFFLTPTSHKIDLLFKRKLTL